MWKWLWGPVIVQSALLAFLLCKLTMAVLQTTKQQIITWVTLIIGLLTGAGAITSYIMPDVFTAIMLLAGIIYLIDNAQPKALRP